MKEQKKNVAVEIVNEQRERIVKKIIKDMQERGLRWSEPYLPSMSPNNPTSGTVYQGGNRLHLGFVGYMRGYEDNRWCTYNQIKNNGWYLKKGSKAAIIERWKEYTFTDKSDSTEEQDTQDTVKHIMRCVGYWNVFNAEEIDGIPPVLETAHKDDYTAEIAANLVLSSRCPVNASSRYRGIAAYSPSSDAILIAPRRTFRSDESFTRVLLHEMTHSTGHPSALGRECSTKFGSPAYAEEELVAELGSLFLSSDLGIQSCDLEGEFYENHVAYLQSWMHALEDDPSYLFKAAAKADKADNYIVSRYDSVLERSHERAEEERSGEKVVTLAGEARAAKDATTILVVPVTMPAVVAR